LLLEQGNKDFIKGKRKGKGNDVIRPWGRDFIKGKEKKKKKKKNFVPRPREDRITKKNHELEMGEKKKKNTLLWSTTRSNKKERKICIMYTLQTLEAERR
jgi:hypothetical protein